MRRVVPGERLAMRAADYNAFVDAAEYVAARKHNRGIEEASEADDTILVKSVETTVAIPRFGLVRLDGVGGAYDTLVECVRPDAVTPLLEYVGVAACPIAPGEVGSAWVSGWHPVLCANADTLSYPCRGVSQQDSFEIAYSAGGNIRLLGQAPSRDSLLLALAELPPADLPPAPSADAVLKYNATTGLVEWIETTTSCP